MEISDASPTPVPAPGHSKSFAGDSDNSGAFASSGLITQSVQDSSHQTYAAASIRATTSQ